MTGSRGKLSQKMATTLLALVGSLVACIGVTAAAAAAAATGDVAAIDGPPVVVLEGHQADILCQHNVSLIYCRIIVPGEPKAFVLSEKLNKQPGFLYYGSGRSNGQCGISIRQVQTRNGGPVTCNMGIEGEELTQTVQLTVALPPLRPKLEIVSATATGEKRSIRNASFEIDEQVSVKCVSPNGRPAAQLAWYLDEVPLSGDNVGPAETIKSPSKGNQTVELYTAIQTIVLHMRATDDNKTLVCRATQSGQSQEAQLKLKVGFRPQPQPPRAIDFAAGQTAHINLTVAANPSPRTAWIVAGERVEPGNQHGRFVAHEPIGVGNGIYNVSLSIVSLQPEDAATDVELRASNQYGHQEYLVQLSASQPHGAGGVGSAGDGADGPRAYSVPAVLWGCGAVAILMTIAMLAVARLTGRCCFARPGSDVGEPITQEKV